MRTTFVGNIREKRQAKKWDYGAKAHGAPGVELLIIESNPVMSLRTILMEAKSRLLVDGSDLSSYRKDH